MKVAALRNTDPWFARMQRALGAGSLDAIVLKDVPVESVVQVTAVGVHFDDEEVGHRPWLQISGVLSQIRPAVELPYGVDELTFVSRPGTPMDYRYDFADSEIARLILTKGLYQPGFRVPEEVVNIEWELPGQVDVLFVSPEGIDDPPLVFVDIKDQNSGRLTTENSGYDLVEYFPDRVPESALGEAEHDKVRTSADQMRDLFAGESLDDLVHEEALVRKPRVAQDEAPEPTSFDELVARANRLREQANEKTRAELRELDPKSADAVYAERMAQLLSEDEELFTEGDDLTLEEVGVGLPDDEVESEAAARRRAEAQRILDSEEELPDEPRRRETDLSFD